MTYGQAIEVIMRYLTVGIHKTMLIDKETGARSVEEGKLDGKAAKELADAAEALHSYGAMLDGAVERIGTLEERIAALEEGKIRVGMSADI